MNFQRIDVTGNGCQEDYITLTQSDLGVSDKEWERIVEEFKVLFTIEDTHIWGCLEHIHTLLPKETLVKFIFKEFLKITDPLVPSNYVDRFDG